MYLSTPRKRHPAERSTDIPQWPSPRRETRLSREAALSACRADAPDTRGCGQAPRPSLPGTSPRAFAPRRRTQRASNPASRKQSRPSMDSVVVLQSAIRHLARRGDAALRRQKRHTTTPLPAAVRKRALSSESGIGVHAQHTNSVPQPGSVGSVGSVGSSGGGGSSAETAWNTGTVPTFSRLL